MIPQGEDCTWNNLHKRWTITKKEEETSVNRKQDNWEDLCQAIRLGCDIHVLVEMLGIEGSSASNYKSNLSTSYVL